ncbi:MAG TPA: bifunctional phosphoribosylaminoimidazolecarboxamide formyltransferase/IMP cyclohydrolase [Patescibacteria group bacterium]|nr:bifunctional phosphoribosylaminoimidazolecarboxamide formyltransferase/IMP cyclohydrolase [Patescibacteria group bacterium]
MRALLSVANRQGVADLARDLLALGIEVHATDGTREHLAENGIDVRPVTALTNVPPLLGGTVKTFHPAIYAGILARRDRPEQLAELVENAIGLIDLVVVNVAPFAPQVGERRVPLDEAIEMIDVGGTALLSAAARNHAGVVAVPGPAAYEQVVTEIRARGSVSAELRQRLAAEAFAVVAAYNAQIAAYLNQVTGTTFPLHISVVLEKVTDLAHGENPHQRAAFYRETTHRDGTLADATRLQGREPSFNDLLDLDAAWRIASDFAAPTAVVVRHTDPVGVASDHTLAGALRRALETDPAASFGSTVAVNRTVDEATAQALAEGTFEGLVALGYDEEALRILSARPELELLAVPPNPADGLRDYGIAALDFKRVAGGLLVETLDGTALDRGQLRVMTRRRPTLDELTDLMFAWRVAAHVRSNAIVLARNLQTVGIGGGQVSRQVAVEIALRRAGDRARTAVMSSDAYFPFPDVIAHAAVAGVTAIIQPGGSRRDEMAIEVADRHHLAMVFTGRRHFRH